LKRARRNNFLPSPGREVPIAVGREVDKIHKYVVKINLLL
jgi:hypothetical protein